jgi:hypothetical protein
MEYGLSYEKCIYVSCVYNFIPCASNLHLVFNKQLLAYCHRA